VRGPVVPAGGPDGNKWTGRLLFTKFPILKTSEIKHKTKQKKEWALEATVFLRSAPINFDVKSPGTPHHPTVPTLGPLARRILI
jgi:hypothetical protein